MAISYVGRQKGTAALSSANKTVSYALAGGASAAPQADDDVFISIQAGSTAAQAAQMVTAGFTLVTNLYTNGNPDPTVYVFHKRMGSTPDADFTFKHTNTVTNQPASYSVEVFRGLHATSPYRAVIRSSYFGIPNFTGLAPLVTGEALVLFTASAFLGSPTLQSLTADATLDGSQVDTMAGPNAGTIGMAWGSGHKLNAGAFTPGAWTFSRSNGNDACSSASIALVPADGVAISYGTVARVAKSVAAFTTLTNPMSQTFSWVDEAGNPVTAQQGDLVEVYALNATNAQRLFTAHASSPGWAVETAVTVNATSADLHLIKFWKVMGSSPDTGITLALSSTSGGHPALFVAFLYRGNDPSVPYCATPGSTQGQNTVITASPVQATSGVPGALAAFAYGGAGANTGAPTSPAWSGVDELVFANQAGSTAYMALLFAGFESLPDSSPFSPGAPTVTYTTGSGDSYGGYTSVIRPAVADLPLAPTGLKATPAVGLGGVTALAQLAPRGLLATPALGRPAITPGTTASPIGLAATPVLGRPAITPGTLLAPRGLVVGPVLGRPGVTADTLVGPRGLVVTPALGRPAITALAQLAPLGLVLGPVLGRPMVYDGATVQPRGLVVAPVLGRPAITPVAQVVPLGLAAAPTLGRPAVTPGTLLGPRGLALTPVLGRPAVTPAAQVAPQGLALEPVLGRGAVIAETLVSSRGLIAAPMLGRGVITVASQVAPLGLRATPILDRPSVRDAMIVAELVAGRWRVDPLEVVGFDQELELEGRWGRTDMEVGRWRT